MTEKFFPYLSADCPDAIIFYNKTIFAEVGIEVPETIDELEAACDKLVAAGYVPFALANGSKWTGSMYYMYLVARHSGNAEFDAAIPRKAPLPPTLLSGQERRSRIG